MMETNRQQFGKYQIEEELGRGGFGTVFRAIDTTLDRPVALKILDPLLMRDRGWVDRFRREARLMARLDHPHIVPIYETGTLEGRLFLAMKLIDGQDLAQRITRSGHFSWEETLAVLGQIAGALDYAHTEGLVHRDLKPSNILLANGSAVLTDFGLSMLASANTMSVSLTGGVIGTPSYIPPEAWENREVTGLADQYALACLVHEMLTGRILFTGDTPPAIMMAHYQPPDFPQEWPAGVPEGVDEVLAISLARDPRQRYATCGELAAALRRLQTDALARPYAALQRAVQAEKWEEALDLADQIRARAADYRDVVALENEAMAGLAAAQKAAAAVQWREQAQTALTAGNLAAARTAALQWQELSGDPAAADFLARLDKPAPPEETIEVADPEPRPESGQPLLPQGPPVRAPQPGRPPRDSEEDRPAPLPLPQLDRPTSPSLNPTWLWVGGIVGLLVIGLILWRVFSPPDTVTVVTRIPAEEAAMVEEMAEEPADAAAEEEAAEEEAAEEEPAPAAEEPVQEPVEEAAEPEPEPAGEPLRGQGGTLILFYWQQPSNLNPYLSGAAIDFEIASVVLEPLLVINDRGDPEPRLVVEVPTVENGGLAPDLTVMVYRLRDDIFWSDGTPFTADDVVFTFDYCTNPGTSCASLDLFEGIAGVTALDDFTVEVKFFEPTPSPYTAFVSYRSPILQRAQFDGCIGAAAADCVDQNFAPVGTGPFAVADFHPEHSEAAFVVNDFYRDPDRPYFNKLVVLYGGDAQAAAEAVLVKGEADYAWNLQVEPEVLDDMVASGLGQTVSAFGTLVERLMVNFTNPDPSLGDNRSEYLGGSNPHPFLSDIRVRLALSLAIDRQTISDVGYGLHGRPTCNVIPAPPAFVSSANDSCLNPDPELAQQLLAEAGYVDANGDGLVDLPDGSPMVVVFQTSTNSVRQTTQDLIAGWWADIGVGTELRNINAGVYFVDRDDPNFYGRFYADIEMYTNSAAGYPGIPGYMKNWTCDEIAGAANNWFGNNVPRYCNPEYDALYRELSRTADLGEQAELVKTMNDILMQDVVMIPLVHRGSVSAHANSLHGVRINPWDSELWNIADWTRDE